MKVAVVGAGVAGLVAARDLAAAGHRVTVLEGADRVGGCVVAHEVAGLRLDAGAESFATRSAAVPDLLAELGLTGQVVTPAAAGAWVHRAGRTVPLPRTGVLGIPARPWSGDVRQAVGLPGAVRASLDRVLPVGRAGAQRSLGALVRSRMGHRVLERLVAPVVGGVHSAHPDDVDLDTVLPGLRERLTTSGSLAAAVAQVRAAAPAGSAVAGLDGGMHVLVEALLGDLRARQVTVRTSAAVRELSRTERGWRLAVGTHGAPDADAAGFDHVVLAVPGPAALALLAPSVPGLAEVDPPQQTSVVLATLVLDAPALDGAPRGTGVLVADDAAGPVRAKALTHATAKWAWLARRAGPGRHVLRLSYGRPGAAPPTMTEPELRATALADVRTLLGVPVTEEQVVGFARARWSTGLPHARPGHAERVRQVRAAVASTPGLSVCGAWVAGTGLAAVVADARRTAGQVGGAPGGPGPGF